MFSIIPNPTFDTDVRITRPGEAEPGTITFTFKHLGNRECKGWVARAADDHTNDASWLAEVITGWAGPANAAGTAVAYSVEALNQVLNAFPAAGSEIYLAYLRARLESRAKN